MNIPIHHCINRLFNLLFIIETTLFLVSYDAQGQNFIELTQELGIPGLYAANQLAGCGLSLYDWNEDGFDDLTILQRDSLPSFFLNVGGTYFEQVYFEGIDVSNNVKSVNWVDFNNDGHVDLSFNSYEAGPRLYLNNGDFTFQDITATSGLLFGEDHWGYGHNWGDIDQDGLLDLFIANYNWDEAPFIPNYLYRNNGDLTFTEISLPAGLNISKEPTFVGLFGDYNNDNLTDLYVLNDREPFRNLLFRNNGNSTFSNVSLSSGFVYIMCSMCATSGDFDNDGFFDMFITNTDIVGTKLFKNSATSTFSEQSAQFNLNLNQYSWGSTWIDYDNDGWQDLLVGTQEWIGNPTNVGENLLLRNTPLGFEYQIGSGFSGYNGITNAVARGDINNDGKPDLVTHSQFPLGANIWINQTEGGNYLRTRLKGQISNKDAIGCRLELYSASGPQYRYTFCGEQFLSQNSQWIHFGLGNDDHIDSLTIIWPSGFRDHYYNLDVNQNLVLSEGSSITNEIVVTSGELTLCPGEHVTLDGGIWESYQWSTGDTTRYITLNESDTIYLVVFDGTFYIESDPVIVQSTNSVLESSQVTHPSCFEESDGSIILGLNQPADEIELSWNTGSTATQLTNLVAGTYQVTIQYGNDCSETRTFNLINPEPLILQTIYTEQVNLNPDCPQGINLFADFVGGIPPFSFNWLIEYANGTSTVIETTEDSLVCFEFAENILVTCIVTDAHQCTDSISTFIEGISSELDAENEFLLYPNPAKNFIHIQGLAKIQTAILWDSQGKEIPVEFIHEAQTGKYKVMLDNISAGAYLLTIISNDQVEHFKITKQ